MAKEIRVPTLGESVTEATIGQWFKKVGDAVADGETLVELETDKVTLEVPAPAAGTLGQIVANEGDTVEVDALLGMLEEGAGAAGRPSSGRSGCPGTHRSGSGAGSQAGWRHGDAAGTVCRQDDGRQGRGRRTGRRLRQARPDPQG